MDPVFFEWLAEQMGDHDSCTIQCSREGREFEYVQIGKRIYYVYQIAGLIRNSDYAMQIIETSPVQLVVRKREIDLPMGGGQPPLTAIGTNFLKWVAMHMGGRDPLTIYCNDHMEFNGEKISRADAVTLLQTKYHVAESTGKLTIAHFTKPRYPFLEWLDREMGDHDTITIQCVRRDNIDCVDTGNQKYATTDAIADIYSINSKFTARIIETSPVQLVVNRRGSDAKFLDWVNTSGGCSLSCWNDFVEFGEDRIHTSDAIRLLEPNYDCEIQGQGSRCGFVARRKRTETEIAAAEFAESLRANFVLNHGVFIDLLKTEMRRVSKFQSMICVKRVQDGYQTDDNIFKVPECPYAVLRSAFPPPFRFTEERDGFVISW